MVVSAAKKEDNVGGSNSGMKRLLEGTEVDSMLEKAEHP
jgi:hypothetical protein